MSHNKMPRFDSINVIPLIDVILVLLAIVLTTASFIVKDNLQIDLPETSNTQTYTPAKDQTPVYFHIDQHNQLYLDEIPKTLNAITPLIRQLTKTQPIILQVDKKATFGTFVSLIDALKGQNLTNLTILTEGKNSPPINRIPPSIDSKE